MDASGEEFEHPWVQGAAGTELDRTDESKPHPNNREHKGRSAQKQRLEKQGEREGGRPRRAGGRGGRERGREGGPGAQAGKRARQAHPDTGTGRANLLSPLELG